MHAVSPDRKSLKSPFGVYFQGGDVGGVVALRRAAGMEEIAGTVMYARLASPR